jgi:selenoprotein W-related protein
LAAELQRAFPDAEIRLIPSSGGVFEVELDGKVVFSKKASRRHAAPGEVLALVREAAGQRGGGAA